MRAGRKSELQLYISAGAALFLGFYGFTMPECPPAKSDGKRSLVSALGLDAFVLFRRQQMVVFFLFAMMLGAALQITNAFGGEFLDDFKTAYPGSFGVEHPNLLLSISQISETLFILTIPFFLQRFGIKKVMLISIFAWVFRFGLFAVGDPGAGLWMLVLSMIIYGMAFDFFNISGAMFVDREAEARIRASAQGLFMIMTNGLGAFVGGMASGWVVDHFTANGVKDWQSIWLTFAGYALILGIVFPLVFRYRHDPHGDGKISPAHSAGIGTSKRLLLREPGVGLDFTNLKDVPLLVRRHEQRPLVGIAVLSVHDAAPQVVVGGADVLKQPRMQLMVRVQRSVKIPQSFRHLGWDGLFAIRPIDAVPENVGIARRRFTRAGRFQRVLQDRSSRWVRQREGDR